MVSWNADGGFTGYDAATGSLVADKIKFLKETPGTVDVNAVTRMHRPVASGTPYWYQIVAHLPLKITQADYDASRNSVPFPPPPWMAISTRYPSAHMAVAPASAFDPDAVPTPSQIRSAATMTYRAKTRVEARPRASGRDMVFEIDGPRAADLTPNTKYWIAVYPMAVGDVTSSSGTHPSDIPIPGTDLNVVGRAASFWTNRRPEAPVITSPPSGSVVNAGSTVSLSFSGTDPDAVFGGTTPRYTDIAGVQVQYAPRATPSNPTPAWTNLPFANGTGFPDGPGWYIDALLPYGLLPLGAKALWENGTVTVRCGDNTHSALEGILPSGDWQIRMRTFDYGHPFPATRYAISGAVRSPSAPVTLLTDVEDSLASPWSAPINIAVAAQVPPPILMSPRNGSAVPVGPDLVLRWRYRNTHVPPYAQASRLVQVREVGAGGWVDVASGAGADPFVSIPYPLVAGVEYEWRVKVTDEDAVESNFSETARFWAVSAPASGEVRPLPSGTIDGATLGCGTHRVFVYRRGGLTRVGEIRNLSLVDYSRQRDEVSDARVIVSDWDVDCGNLLAALKTWAFEIVIFRDNGFSIDRVWEGPITRLTYESDQVVINARDVLAYAQRRIIRQAMSDTHHGDTVVSRAARVLRNAFAPDDPNILAYLYPITDGEIARQRRSTPAFSRTAYEEIDDMAAHAGLDYTTVGRSILLWGTKNRIGLLPEFRDKDLGAAPIVSEYGLSAANVYVVSDGNGVYGSANRLPASGLDEEYGLIEVLSSSWASDSEEEQGTYSQESIAKVIESFSEYAEQSISSRWPPPVVVRVPDNTTLNPSAVISIQHLVPGVAIPLRSEGTLRTVRAMQKLDSVKVVEQGGQETVSITMSPFRRQDNETPEDLA